jgi:vitamin B12 transporter
MPAMKSVLTPLLLTLTLLSFGQVQDTSSYHLPEVTLTTSKIALDRSVIGRHVLEISGEELRSNAISVNEGLEHLGSIDVRQRGPFDVQADLGIRGGTFDQSLILIDGIPMMDPQTGHHNLNLPISMDQIDGVEILAGGSRSMGPQAFSGAVNFITARDTGNYTRLRFTGGQYALISGGFDQGVKLGKSQLTLGYTGTKSDGYTRNTDFTNQQLSGRWSHPTEGGEISVQAGWNGKAFGASTFYSEYFPNQFEQTQALYGAVRYEQKKGAWQHRSYAMVRRHFDRFELFREDYDDVVPPVWYTKHNYHRTDVIGAEWASTLQINEQHQTVFALNGRTENIVSNNLGDSLITPIEAENDELYYLGRRRQNYSFNIEHHYQNDAISITAGALFNYHTDFDFDVLPGIDIAYFVSNRSKVFASANKSFRTPTYTDLYYNLGGAFGSENLRPEYAWNYEVGYAQSWNRWTVKTAAFYRDGTDLIDWVSTGLNNIEAANLTDIDIYGLEIEGIYRGKAKAFVQEIRFSYTLLDGDKPEDVVSLYVLDYLQHKIGLSLQHKIWGPFSARWDGSMQDRRDWEALIDGTDIVNPVFLVNARINAHFNALDLFIAANNLLDQNYQDRFGVEQPGIWIYGGATWKIRY